MLFTHLTFLAITSFLPGDITGVSFKKVCLREQNRATVSANRTPAYIASFLSMHPEVEPGEERDIEIKVCTIKLICTAAVAAEDFHSPQQFFIVPQFHQQVYLSVAASRDPDPPKFG